MTTYTKNGFDRTWLDAINNLLEDRESAFRVMDLTPEFWQKYVKPLVEAVEWTGEVESDYVPVVRVYRKEDDAHNDDAAGCGEVGVGGCLTVQ